MRYLGPAQALFQKSYYQLMNDALRENGIVCCQGMFLIILNI